MIKIICHWEKDKKYSVRTAYHLICEEKISSLPEASCV